MNTIFIPISERQQARNVLRTDVLKTLQADSTTRIIFFAPNARIAGYRKECSAPNTIFEGVDIPRESISKVDALFHRLSLFYINSGTSRFIRKKWLFYENRQPIHYAFSLSFLFILGSSRFLQSISRFLDMRLVHDERLECFFDTYKPDLIFTPKITSYIDCSFLRHARKRGIKTVGMIGSWDNITYYKHPFRILPDKLIVHNKILKQEAIKYLYVKEKQIYISGVPHFDRYVTTRCLSREEFYKKIGIDLSKKIILFVSNGHSTPLEWQILTMLDDAIQKGALPRTIVFLVRHHPAAEMFMGDLKPSKYIVFDDSKTTFGEKDASYTEILKKDMAHLAYSLFHSAVTINHCSTMSIEASIFDKPIINPVFDGWENPPFYQSVRRFFTPNHMHYQAIIKSGGVQLTYSIDELVSCINKYLKYPSLDVEGRKRIVEEQCFKLDGHAGKRVGQHILSQV